MEQFAFSVEKRKMLFKFEAGTSRGSFTAKDSWFVKWWKPSEPLRVGMGEAAPLPKLSIDNLDIFEERLLYFCHEGAQAQTVNDFQQLPGIDRFPSIVMALETAFLDWENGGHRTIFDNAFSRGEKEIPINGLIWMGDKEFMLKQITEKVAEGYNCIKMKIGAIDFEQELSLLSYIRERFDKNSIVLRVDANGAFAPSEALKKLEQLFRYDLHSIEQPIKAGQWKTLNELCQQSPIPIALDEELIGLKGNAMTEALDTIQAPCIVLKPTLLGGLLATRQWIELAKERSIEWWMTSALEANVGLNAIAQLCGEYDNPLPQGLGTGQLFHNNTTSDLRLFQGKMTRQTTTFTRISP